MGPAFAARADELAGRTMLVRKAGVVPIECVVRGYLAGSGWKEYQPGGTVCGMPLPPGLRQSEQLPEPIFTPATKEEVGHDMNISFEQMARIAGATVAESCASAASTSTAGPPTMPGRAASSSPTRNSSGASCRAAS